MNAEALEEIRQNLEAADYFSDSEKELFFDILPGWPEDSLQALLQALGDGKPKVVDSASPVQAAVVKPAVAQAPKPTAEGARVEDLRKFLSSKTVSFKSQNTQPVSQNIERTEPVIHDTRNVVREPHKVTVEDVLKPPPPIKETPNSKLQTPNKIQASISKPQPPEPPWGFGRPVKIDDISSSEELSRLTLTHLRQGDFNQNLKKVIDKILQIAQKESVLPYTVIQSFDKSPVNQLFIQTGLALMDDISKDRSGVFSRIENMMKNEHRLAFNSEEFHAFTDFKTELDKLF